MLKGRFFEQQRLKAANFAVLKEHSGFAILTLFVEKWPSGDCKSTVQWQAGITMAPHLRRLKDASRWKSLPRAWRTMRRTGTGFGSPSHTVAALAGRIATFRVLT